MNTICAWCLAEQGEQPQETDSHGICPRHAEQMRLAAQWRQLQRMPSYVEREATEYAQEEVA